MKNKIILGILSILGLSLIVFFIVNKDVDAEGNNDIVKEEIVSNSNKEKSTNNKVMVDIKGAVKKPGVYEVDNNKRVIDQTTPNMIQRISGIFERNPLISKEI